jgi:hypothetical protein
MVGIEPTRGLAKTNGPGSHLLSILLGRKTEGLSQKFEDFENIFVLSIHKDSWNSMRHPMFVVQLYGVPHGIFRSFCQCIGRKCF